MKFLIKTIIILAALTLFGWTAWQNLAPSGVLEARYDFDAISPFITSLLPGDRALAITRDAIGTYYQSIIDEPVYFRIRAPRRFHRATVAVRFQNAAHPVLELGGIASRNPDAYDLLPLENQMLDGLAWSKLTEDGITLYQRSSEFSSITEFFEQLPPRTEIATYHARVETPFRISEYRPDAATHVIDYSLRGSHTFYAYVKNEMLDVQFLVQDMNRDAGGDPIAMTVYAGTTPVGTVSMFDDGRTRAGDAPSTVQPLALAIPGLPEGAYRIEFRTTRDVFIRKIETRSKKFVIADTIFLGDEAGYMQQDRPATLWTSGRFIRAETLHADGAQELTIGDEILRISESHTEYRRRVAGGTPTRILSPQGDLVIRTNGLFAFQPDALFIPEPKRLSWDTNLDAEGINYILASYDTPETDGDWKIARATFDLSKLLWEDYAVPFVISAPGISELQNEVRVSEISVRFEREPQSLPSIFKDVWQKIKRKQISNSRE